MIGQLENNPSRSGVWWDHHQWHHHHEPLILEPDLDLQQMDRHVSTRLLVDHR